MRFSVTNLVAAPRAAVADAYADPSFYARLDAVPNIGPPDMISCLDDGVVARMEIRYRFAGHLAPAARRVLDPGKLTWVHVATLDRDKSRLDFRLMPDHYRDRLECTGTIRFEEADRGRTAQQVEGVVTVHFPLVARAVERAIVSGLTEHLAQEARVLEEFVRDA